MKVRLQKLADFLFVALVIVMSWVTISDFLGLRLVHPDRLPIVRYLKSAGATSKCLVCVVDNSFDQDDKEIMQRVLPVSGRFLNGLQEKTFSDGESSHGTMVARVVGKILPDASFLFIRIFSKRGEGGLFVDPEYCADAICDMGVKVMVISLEFYAYHWALNFTRRALDRGMIVVYSGTNNPKPIEEAASITALAQLNEGRPGCAIWVGADFLPGYPAIFASYPTTHLMRKWFFSAPGVNVETGAGVGNGASFAAPVVAGVVCLLIGLFPDASPKEIIRILRYISDNSVGRSVWHSPNKSFQYILDYVNSTILRTGLKSSFI